MAEVSIESCLPFVPLLYSYQMVYVTQVKLSKMVAPYKILKTDVSKGICFFKVIELRPQKSTRWLKDLPLCEPKPWEDQDQIMLAANASLMYLMPCIYVQGAREHQGADLLNNHTVYVEANIEIKVFPKTFSQLVIYQEHTYNVQEHIEGNLYTNKWKNSFDSWFHSIWFASDSQKYYYSDQYIYIFLYL